MIDFEVIGEYAKDSARLEQIVEAFKDSAELTSDGKDLFIGYRMVDALKTIMPKMWAEVLKAKQEAAKK